MTRKDARDQAAQAGVEQAAYGQARQLGARLLELTPELAAHYADLPTAEQKPETD